MTPSNVYVDITTDTGILNDWGSSCPLNESICWEGTDQYSIRPKDGQFHFPQISDDLVMLLKCVYTCVNREYPDRDMSITDIESFWNRRILYSNNIWNDAYKLALANDYEGLKRFFSTVK